MSDKISGFQIHFYKNINHISESQKLTINEQFEAGEKATFYIESLVFFITGVDKHILKETDSDDFQIHLENIREIINAFVASARESLNRLENRRIELEVLVEKLPTIGQIKKAR